MNRAPLRCSLTERFLAKLEKGRPGIRKVLSAAGYRPRTDVYVYLGKDRFRVNFPAAEMTQHFDRQIDTSQPCVVVDGKAFTWLR